MQPHQRASKKDVFLTFLETGWVSVHMDARHPGVSVPVALAQSPQLILQYGHDMPVAIPDLEITDHGVSATLSFARISHKTMVPWPAVFALVCTDGRQLVFPEDIPEDVLETAPEAPTAAAKELARSGHPRPRGALQAEPGPGSADVSGTETRPVIPARLRAVPSQSAVLEADQSDAARQRKKPRLRLVK